MPEQVTKLKKKQWYPIIAPKQFDNVVLGETLVYEPNQLLGKTLSLSLMNLMRDTKRQNISIHFKVFEVDDNKAKASIIGFHIVNSSIKRFVRRNSDKIDASFNCETADNVRLRVKPLLITKNFIKGSIGAKLRYNAASFLSKTIKKITYDEVINDLISHKLQDTLKASLNKIYPLKVCEVRYAGIEAMEKKEEANAEAKEKPQEVDVEVKE